MQGTITIRIKNAGVIAFEMEVSHVTRSDKLILLDGLVRALSCDKQEREIYGLTIAAGGISAIAGEEPVVAAMPMSVVNKLRKNRPNGEKPSGR